MFGDPLIKDKRLRLGEIESPGDIYLHYTKLDYEGWFWIDSLGFDSEVIELRREVSPEAEEIVVEDSGDIMTSDE